MTEPDDLYEVACIDAQIGTWVPAWVLGPSIPPSVVDATWVFPNENDLLSWRSWLIEQIPGLEARALWYARRRCRWWMTWTSPTAS